MVVQIGIEVRAVELLQALGVRGVDVAVAQVLADHGSILGLHQPVVVAVPRPAYPGSVFLLRARWLSILSMPSAPGSSCVGIPPPLQAHLVLEKTSP